jgi:CRISPR-associated protein Csm2
MSFDRQKSNGPRPGGSSGGGGGGGNRRESSGPTSFNLAVNLARPDAGTFDTLAEEVAKKLSSDRDLEGNSFNKNKPAQLRRFYDEIVMWDQKIRQSPEALAECLPLIRMLNAKVAYAQARELVTGSFREMIRHLLQQLDADKPGTFENLKLFMESVMGFYKLHGPRD